MPPRRQARMCSGNETTETAGNANTISRLSQKVTHANSSALPHLLTAKTEHNAIKCESEEKSRSVWERIKACLEVRKAEVAIKESNRQYEAAKAREAAQVHPLHPLFHPKRRLATAKAAAIKESKRRRIIEYEVAKAREAEQRRFAAAINESKKRHIIEYEADIAREAAQQLRFAATKAAAKAEADKYKQLLKKAILEHDDSGRLSCLVISDRTMCTDCAETFNTIHNNIINELNLDLPMSGYDK
jgi:hypothetical protein